MWLMVMFDLPVETRDHRRAYRKFLDKLEDDGFFRLQFSVYARPCATEENTLVHENRVRDAVPEDGEVRVLKFTDKQWGRMKIFRNQLSWLPEQSPPQLTFFSEDELDENEKEIAPRVAVKKSDAYDLQAWAERPLVDQVAERQAVMPPAKPTGKKKGVKTGGGTPSFEFYD